MILFALSICTQSLAAASDSGAVPPKSTIEVAPEDAAEYSLPLKFDPEDNGLSIDNPQLKWSIDERSTIDMDGLKISPDMLGFALHQTARDAAPARFDSSKEKLITIISFRWPEIMSRIGLLTIEGEGGKVLWSKQLTEDDRTNWKNDLSYLPGPMKEPHDKSSFGLIGASPTVVSFFYHGGTFRSCLTKVNSKLEKIRLCAAPFNIIAKGESLQLVDPHQDPKANDKNNSSFALNGTKMLTPETTVTQICLSGF